MSDDSSFLTAEEAQATRTFLDQGYVIQSAESPVDLDRIRALAAAAAAEYLQVKPGDVADLLDHAHRWVAPASLNGLRLHVIQRLNQAPWIRPAYYRLGRNLLGTLVGNELAMQLRLNLSIQLPGDSGSLLPVHADTWSGDSPFEVVLWVPLVDCHGTKSMFLLPPGPAARLHDAFPGLSGINSEALYRKIEPDLKWMEVNYGEVLLFNQNLPHGNRVNEEMLTRWTMNCRFKAVFTPYADKQLGEFFEPITLRAASRLGLDYRLPGVGQPAAER